MGEKMDRRKVRTKKLLRAAMLELIEEKGVKGITVSDLTSRADINRGTFYLHYQDVDDLINQLQDQFFSELQNRTKKMDMFEFNNARDKPYPALISILEFIEDQADLLRVLFGPKGDPSFVMKWKQFMKEQVSNNFSSMQIEEEKMLVPREYLITFIISAQLGIIQYWIETGLQRSPEEIATIITQIANRGPLGAISLEEQDKSQTD